MNIGWMGLGRMGSGMAANLVKAGHEVTVYNRTPGKARSLIERGAKPAASVGEACRGDLVVTMLADDVAVESVVFSDKGILASLAKGRIHISMSTISVALSERLAAAHAAAGQRYVAAPVFGRPTNSPRRASSSSRPEARQTMSRPAGPRSRSWGRRRFISPRRPGRPIL